VRRGAADALRNNLVVAIHATLLSSLTIGERNGQWIEWPGERSVDCSTDAAAATALSGGTIRALACSVVVPLEREASV
jgi:hypothetical protein